MKLWVDDIRRPPDGSWEWARTNREAQVLLLSNECDEASLDHDMGLHDFDPDMPNADMSVAPDAQAQPDGTELVAWMIRNEVIPPVVTCHSWNPDGARRMAYMLRDAGCPSITVAPFDPAVRA